MMKQAKKRRSKKIHERQMLVLSRYLRRAGPDYSIMAEGLENALDRLSEINLDRLVIILKNIIEQIPSKSA